MAAITGVQFVPVISENQSGQNRASVVSSRSGLSVHRNSEVMLCSPATAAASAVTGFITDARKLEPTA